MECFRHEYLLLADEIPELIFEYIRRDLLNRILGNSDNHGRKTSIFRYKERFDLAPIYDLAPMVLDAEGITRTTKWEAEKKGSPEWREICGYFPHWYTADDLYERIRGAVNEFRALPDLMTATPSSKSRTIASRRNNAQGSVKQDDAQSKVTQVIARGAKPRGAVGNKTLTDKVRKVVDN